MDDRSSYFTVGCLDGPLMPVPHSAYMIIDVLSTLLILRTAEYQPLVFNINVSFNSICDYTDIFIYEAYGIRYSLYHTYIAIFLP